MQKRINHNPRISGGIYFINNITSLILGNDWTPLTNFIDMSPNLYFSLENNKLKYIKGKSILPCNISWSMSIKSENEFKARLINGRVISEIKDVALFTKVIGNNSFQKILLNESFGIEVCSEIKQEILISSAFITISE